MAAPAKSETPEYTTAPPIDEHAAPVADRGAKSGRAKAAMILGIVGVPLAVLIPIAGIIFGILAIVFGAIARGEINRRGLTNRGQALAGIILGALDIVLAIILIAAYAASHS